MGNKPEIMKQSGPVTLERHAQGTSTKWSVRVNGVEVRSLEFDGNPRMLAAELPELFDKLAASFKPATVPSISAKLRAERFPGQGPRPDDMAALRDMDMAQLEQKYMSSYGARAGDMATIRAMRNKLDEVTAYTTELHEAFLAVTDALTQIPRGGMTGVPVAESTIYQWQINTLLPALKGVQEVMRGGNNQQTGD